jgi:hypothetical protein
LKEEKDSISIVNSGALGSMKASQSALASISSALGSMKASQSALASISSALGSMKANQSALASISSALGSMKANQSALASISSALGSMKANQSALASISSALGSMKANQSALASISSALGSMKANQGALASISSALRSMKVSQGALASAIGSAAGTSIDFGKTINALVNAGAIARLQDSLQRASNLRSAVFASMDLGKTINALVDNDSLIRFQAKLVQAVELGIPEHFLESLNRISNFSVTDYDVFSNDDASLLESQIEQNIEELNEEFNENPAGIWAKLNTWATRILESPTILKEKLPFIFLILYVMYLLANFVIVPAVQDIIKEKVLHELHLSEEKPKQNVKAIKTSLSKEYEITESMINRVRVTLRQTPVYRSPKRKSGRIDSIDVNQPVIVIHKKRNWCFIMYTNKYDEEVTGWVFTGSLAK